MITIPGRLRPAPLLAVGIAVVVLTLGPSRARDEDARPPGAVTAIALADSARLVIPGLARDASGVPLAYVLPLPGELRPGANPVYNAGTRYASRVALERERYRAQDVDYHPQLQDYRTNGDYLNYGVTLDYRPGSATQVFAQLPVPLGGEVLPQVPPPPDPILKFDSNGVPMVSYGGVAYYNPTTVAQFTLHLHGRYARGLGTAAAFLKAADFLVTRQSPDGAFRYPFAFQYYLTGEVFPVGWVSAMAQGQALSVLARAYLLTGNSQYRSAGDSALAFLLRPNADGGLRSDLSGLSPALERFVTFEEYPSRPGFLTLNGFMYTMLGLYDWGGLEPDGSAGPSSQARDAFDQSLATLVYTLPYYDAGGFSAYDLGHVMRGSTPNLQAWYHAHHISLLHALNSVAPHAQLAAYETNWRDDVR